MDPRISVDIHQQVEEENENEMSDGAGVRINEDLCKYGKLQRLQIGNKNCAA